MTDPHVHLRDFNQKEKETILHGLRTAYSCGFNILLDMPNTDPSITSRTSLLKRLEKAEEDVRTVKAETHCSDIYYSVYLGLTEDEEEVREMTELYREFFPSVCGLKLFASQSTGNMGIVNRSSQERIYSLLASFGYDGVLAVHAEKESLFRKYETMHSKTRPAESEIYSVSDQIESAVKAGFRGKLHIAHISTKGALNLVREARKDGEIHISCGATPHHSLLTVRNEGIFTKMNPPLREKSDRDSIIEGLFDGTVDWAESDHAPHTLSDKMKGASGIPGFEGMLRLISFLRKEGMKEERLNGLFSENAISVFALPFRGMGVPSVITDEMIEKAGREYPFSAWTGVTEGR